MSLTTSLKFIDAEQCFKAETVQVFEGMEEDADVRDIKAEMLMMLGEHNKNHWPDYKFGIFQFQPQSREWKAHFETVYESIHTPEDIVGTGATKTDALLDAVAKFKERMNFDLLPSRGECTSGTLDSYGRLYLASPTVEPVASAPFTCALNWELGEGVSEFIAVTQRLSSSRVFSYYALYISDEEKVCSVGFYENAFTTCGHGEDRFLRWEGPPAVSFLEAMRAAEVHHSTNAQKFKEL